MIDCEKCREMISCLLDGELSQANRASCASILPPVPNAEAFMMHFSAVSEQMHEEEPLPEELHEKDYVRHKGKAEEENRYSVDKISVRSGMPCPCHIRRSQKRYVRPAENKVDSIKLYVEETLPVLDGRFTGQTGNGDKNNIYSGSEFENKSCCLGGRQLKSSAHCLRRQKMRTANMSCRARPITRSALMTVSSLILCSFILMTAAPMPITETELCRRRFGAGDMRSARCMRRGIKK